MILFDEMNLEKPIQIFDNYKLHCQVYKSFFAKKAFVYKGKSTFIKLKNKKSLDNEIKEFLNEKKNISDISFASDIIKISNKVINQ